MQTLQHPATSGGAPESGEPLTKKRKLDDSVTKCNTYLNGEGNSSLEGDWESAPFKGISFSVPQRKKLSLQISTKRNEGIRALNPSTNQKEFGIPWGEIGKSRQVTAAFGAEHRLSRTLQNMFFASQYQKKHKRHETSVSFPDLVMGSQGH